MVVSVFVLCKPVFRFLGEGKANFYRLSLFLPTPGSLFYSKLCPPTAGRSPPPESSSFLCPLLSFSKPLPVAPQCHLSNDVLVFQLILHPLSATLCFQQSIYALSSIQVMCPAHFHFLLVTYWTMSVTLSFFA